MLVLMQVSAAIPVEASRVDRALNEALGALDRLSATIDRTFGGATKENTEAIKRSEAQAPQTSALIGGWSDSWEASMGERVHQEKRRDPGFVNSPTYVNPLTRVARNLVRHADRNDLTWRFAVLDTDEVNAFAAPGGYVYVTKGLMDMVGSEDELAGIVAHEIGHIDKKHAVKSMRRNGGLAILIGGLGLWDKTRDYAVPAGIAAYFAGLKFSRDDEFEADAHAVDLTHKAGYDPNGLVTFLERINRGSSSASRITKYFSTHPPTSDRIRAAQKRIENLPPRQASADSQNQVRTPQQQPASSQPPAQTQQRQPTASSSPPPTQQQPQVHFPSQHQLQAAYEEYLFKREIYQHKVTQQAPVNELMEALREYQQARDRYLAMRKAAGL